MSLVSPVRDREEAEMLFNQHIGGYETKELSGAPCPRFGHTAVLYGDKMVLFGGRDDGCHGDLWNYHFMNKTWERIHPLNIGPSPRAGHTAVVHDDKMYIFGGVEARGGVHNCWLNDTWYLDLKTLTWMNIHPGSSANLPNRRKGHTSVVYNNSMYVFGGGQDDSLMFNDLWELDLITERWVEASFLGNSPCPRIYHTGVMGKKGNMYIFGGRAEGTAGFLNDVYELNLVTMSSRLLPVTGTPPGNRMCSASVIANNVMAVFCGGAYSYLEDSHQLDLETLEWKPISHKIKFGGRTRPTTVMWRNTIMTFGGCVTGNGYVNSYVEINLDPMSLKDCAITFLRTCPKRFQKKELPNLPHSIAAAMHKRAATSLCSPSPSPTQTPPTIRRRRGDLSPTSLPALPSL